MPETFGTSGRATVGAALALILGVSCATAETGIAFGEMPVGCRWRTEFSDRPDEISTYAGPARGRHVVEVADTRGRVLYTSFYTDEGHYAERRFSDGRWERLTPHSCFAMPGSCRSTYERGDGLKVRQWSEVRRQGEDYHVRAGEVGGARYANETFRLGPFNVIVRSRNANYAATVTGFERCTRAGS